jgi:hypothetical protein
MGHRPEELSKAIRQFQDEVAAGRSVDPAMSFATICATIATNAADIEIRTIEDAGELAVLAFSRIAGGQNRGLYATDTLAAFSRELGREISTNDMIPVIDKLVAANLILRRGHGQFEVADPFVQRAWAQHMQMRQALTPPPAPSAMDAKN